MVEKQTLPEIKPKPKPVIIKQENIPQFYFPRGKPIVKEQKESTEMAIQKAFENKNELALSEFEPVCTKVCEIPSILRKLLFVRIKLVEKLDEKAEKIPKQTFINFWKKHYENETVRKRVFKLMAKPDTNVIVPDDFKALFQFLLETHPGLEFL